jgi:hypothetical protein
MQRQIRRAFRVLVLFAIGLSGSARADGPNVTPKPMPPGPVLVQEAAPHNAPTMLPMPAGPVVVQDGAPAEGEQVMVGEGGCAADGQPIGAERRGFRPIHAVHSWCKSCLNRHGVACWSHHNTLGCGSCKSECTFIFGSCRAFYGEPCFTGPPPPPAPSGSAPPPPPGGYGSGPTPPPGGYGYGSGRPVCSCPGGAW